MLSFPYTSVWFADHNRMPYSASCRSLVDLPDTPLLNSGIEVISTIPTRYTTYRIEWRCFFYDHSRCTVGKAPLHWSSPRRLAKLTKIVNVTYGCQS